MDLNKELRRHLLELLEGKSAHSDLETVLNDFSVGKLFSAKRYSSPTITLIILEAV